MKTFLNLRLSARLGAAFGFLVLALIVVAVVGVNGVATVHDDGYLLVRHLYVEDGDLKAQDETQKEIDASPPRRARRAPRSGRVSKAPRRSASSRSSSGA